MNFLSIFPTIKPQPYLQPIHPILVMSIKSIHTIVGLALVYPIHSGDANFHVQQGDLDQCSQLARTTHHRMKYAVVYLYRSKSGSKSMPILLDLNNGCSYYRLFSYHFMNSNMILIVNGSMYLSAGCSSANHRPKNVCERAMICLFFFRFCFFILVLFLLLLLQSTSVGKLFVARFVLAIFRARHVHHSHNHTSRIQNFATAFDQMRTDANQYMVFKMNFMKKGKKKYGP